MSVDVVRSRARKLFIKPKPRGKASPYLEAFRELVGDAPVEFPKVTCVESVWVESIRRGFGCNATTLECAPMTKGSIESRFSSRVVIS